MVFFSVCVCVREKCVYVKVPLFYMFSMGFCWLSAFRQKPSIIMGQKLLVGKASENEATTIATVASLLTSSHQAVKIREEETESK